MSSNKNNISTSLKKNLSRNLTSDDFSETDLLEKFEDTKKQLIKTGVDSVPKQRIKYHEKKDFINIMLLVIPNILQSKYVDLDWQV